MQNSLKTAPRRPRTLDLFKDEPRLELSGESSAAVENAKTARQVALVAGEEEPNVAEYQGGYGGDAGGVCVNVAHLNAMFPKFPVTVQDKGWVYGMWYCTTAWMRTHFHGPIR